MDHAAELPAERSETNADEFRERCTRFAIKIEGHNRGGGGREGKNPGTTNSPEGWKLKRGALPGSTTNDLCGPFWPTTCSALLLVIHQKEQH